MGNRCSVVLGASPISSVPFPPIAGKGKQSIDGLIDSALIFLAKITFRTFNYSNSIIGNLQKSR
jgi:hypothetical protein